MRPVLVGTITQVMAAVGAGNQPGTRRNPGQTCDDVTLDRLQREKDNACRAIPGDSCSPSKVSPKKLERRPCSEIKRRIEALEVCAEKRWEVQIECFGGQPDPIHDNALDELDNGLQQCVALEAINCAPGHPMANR